MQGWNNVEPMPPVESKEFDAWVKRRDKALLKAHIQATKSAMRSTPSLEKDKHHKAALATYEKELSRLG